MELKSFFAQDLQGNAIPSPVIYVYVRASNTLATGLEDKDGAELTNPFAGTVNGHIQFAAPAGDYDIRVTGGGREFTITVRFDKANNIRYFGAVADGATNDSAAVLAAEASGYTHIDLLGLSVFTTLTESQVTKKYYNGTLLYLESTGAAHQAKPSAPIVDYEIQRPRTKSPIVDWAGKSVLWLGTSIPHFGATTGDDYPGMFAKALACRVDNYAWSGSTASYDKDGDPYGANGVKNLSMTEDDRQWGLATYGPDSPYGDTYDIVTLGSKMTCDHRILAQFQARHYDCVFLDHNHNDRLLDAGILNPAATTVTAIATGATTAITAPGHEFAVGDAVSLEVVGISHLNYAAARVQAVSGSSITINVDSSGYVGTFTSGVCYKLDRATLFGAFNFLISYIKNCAIRFGTSTCKIVLSGAPNEYTAGRTTPYEIFSNAQNLRKLADKWNLSFFDAAHTYDIKPHDVLTYFPDGIHASTTATRRALANHWIAWAQGGANMQVDDRDFLPSGNPNTFTEQREAIYSKFLGGFGTPGYFVGSPTNLLTDSFTSLAGWTLAGTTPTVITAPWGVGNAVNFNAATATTSTIQRNAALTGCTYAEFDLYVPLTLGLTTGVAKTIGLLRFNIQPTGVTSGQVGGVQLLFRESGAVIRGATFQGGALASYSKEAVIQPATRHKVRIELLQGSATFNGACLIYLDGEYVGGLFDLDYTALTSIPQSVVLGIGSNNLGPVNLSIGNLVIDALSVSDFTQRYTGTFISADIPAKTITVVNGIITTAT